MDEHLHLAAKALLARMSQAGLKLTTAESCTGGLVATFICSVPGSSTVFERGFVTYSNEAKVEMLGVAAGLIAQHGAVSAEVAIAMAEGALAHARADLSISITGIAGPDGGSAEKPVGLVHFAAARKGRPVIFEEKRFGNIGRRAVQEAAVATAFGLLDRLI
jgi:nicotinamide-nucleotide amidase